MRAERFMYECTRFNYRVFPQADRITVLGMLLDELTRLQVTDLFKEEGYETQNINLLLAQVSQRILQHKTSITQETWMMK